MSDIAVKEKIIHDTDIDVETTTPPQYAVVIHNDDLTPVNFVAGLIMSVFNKTAKESYALTMAIHEKGKAIVAIYDYEVAEQKKFECDKASKNFGFPLKVTIEEQE